MDLLVTTNHNFIFLFTTLIISSTTILSFHSEELIVDPVAISESYSKAFDRVQLGFETSVPPSTSAQRTEHHRRGGDNQQLQDNVEEQQHQLGLFFLKGSEKSRMAQIFQKLLKDVVTTSVTPSLSISEAHNTGSLKGLQLEARSTNTSSVAASILASVSNMQIAGASIKASLSNMQKQLLGKGFPVLPFNVKDGSDPNDGQSGPLNEKGVDVKTRNVLGGTHELRPLLQMLGGTSASEYILKLLEEQRESKKLVEDINNITSLSARTL
ncbi:hypothetical protein Tco_0377351 [Tanacetum coccineum]